MNITFQGSPVTIKKALLKKGDKLQDFTIIKNDLSPVSLADTKGKRVFLSVPSLDTGVCSMEVAKFMDYAQGFQDVEVYTVSMDLPFALDRWCQSKNNSNIITASDYKSRSFGEATATYVEELGLLTRAVFVVDEDNIIQYVEYVQEITNEPDYDAVLNAVAAL